jgi:hypothetical protein
VPEGSAQVRVGEAVIVSIMAWLDDNGCPGCEEPCAGSSTSAAGHGPAPSDFSRSAVARGDGDWCGECGKGWRVFPSPCEGEDQR